MTLREMARSRAGKFDSREAAKPRRLLSQTSRKSLRGFAASRETLFLAYGRETLR